MSCIAFFFLKINKLISTHCYPEVFDAVPGIYLAAYTAGRCAWLSTWLGAVINRHVVFPSRFSCVIVREPKGT